MDRMCSTHGRDKTAYKILAVKYEGKKPLRGCKLKWEDNIKINLKCGM
jgi:hypothetical protein